MNYYIRENPITGDICIISSVRSRRPHLFKEETEEEEPIQCPFCPGNETLTPSEYMRVENGKNWIIRVIPNKFPAIPHLHDVIVDSPEHDEDIDSIEHIDKLLEVYKERMLFYYGISGIKYVAVFRNRGKNAGASIPHPHSQVLAIPFYPSRYVKEKRTYSSKGKDVMKEFLERELKVQERVIKVSRNFVVLCAYAPSSPYEIWIVPGERINSFIFENNIRELGGLIKETVSVLKKVLGDNLSYNITFQSAPPSDKDYHYYVRIIPRISVIGGFEMETENIIIHVPPEVATMELRTVMYKERAEKV